MNEATQIQLKVIVERAVRPVRAGGTRKRKMREELLAHVTAVFEDEVKTANEPTALAKTTQRFGMPAELTAQLQQTIAWDERIVWFIGRFLGDLWLRPGESRVHCALRQLGWCSAVWLLDMGLMIMLMPIISRADPWPTPGFLTAIPVIFFLFVACSAAIIFAAHGLWHLLYERTPRSWPMIVLLLMASYAVIPIAVLVFEAADAKLNARHVAYSFHDVPASAFAVPCVLLFGVNLRQRVLTDRAARPWWRTLLFHGGWCLAACAAGFLATLTVSGDLSISRENAQGLALLFLFYLLPIDLIFSIPYVFNRFRSDREWAELPVGNEKGAAV